MSAVRSVYRAGAILFGALALVSGYFAVTLPWAPHIDFDVTGLLWILQNMPRLLAWILTAVFGMGAIYAGVRSALVRRGL